MNMQAYALNAYKQNKAVEAAPIELVIMLYDGRYRFSGQGCNCDDD